jgi:hypothetical protein
VGGTVGATGRGGGEVVTGLTGGLGKPLGDALGTLGDGVQGAAAGLGNAAKRAGEWK